MCIYIGGRRVTGRAGKKGGGRYGKERKRNGGGTLVSSRKAVALGNDGKQLEIGYVSHPSSCHIHTYIYLYIYYY